jgi:amino acid adenylation domain-containing protein
MVNSSGSIASEPTPEPLTGFMMGETMPSRNGLVLERFEAQVTRTPGAIALELEGVTLTYGELNARANQVAHYLRGIGVGPNCLVGVSLERSFDLIIAIYGILKAGGAYVPLDPTYPLERLRYMASAVKLEVLITHSSCTPWHDQTPDLNVLLLDGQQSLLDQQSSSNPEFVTSGDHLIYIIFTSGSTGQPKAAGVYHCGFANLMDWFVDEFRITSDDHALLVSSVSFDLTQKNLFATLRTGGTLHLYPPGAYDLSVLSRLIHDQGITLINCTPSAFYPLIEPLTDCAAHAIASLRIAFLGGEPISIPRVRPWFRHADCRAEIANTYGPTECTDICGFYRLHQDNLDQYDFVPLGRPIRNVQMAIVDQRLQLCAIGEAGELCVGGAGVGAGYINDGELTNEKFVANTIPQITSRLLYRTGDQARWHPSGVIEFLGRLDHQIKIRGFRIELPEIERAVETHPSISEAIVVVNRDDQGNDPQLVCCYTVHSAAQVCVSELKGHLSSRIPSHMVPGIFEPFSTFPLSPNGKVDRKALTVLVRESHRSHAIPESKLELGLEDQIRAAWCQLLNRDQVGLDDNFFDLGGDSLRLARLHQHLGILLNQEFPITDLFAHPTVRGMALHLSGQSNVTCNQSQIRDRARQQREAMAARRRTRS